MNELYYTPSPPNNLPSPSLRPVAKYARLAQLISPAWAPPDLKQPPPPSNALFSIRSDSSGAGLGVTPIMGILYVENPDELRPGEVVVVRESAVTVVTLALEASGAPACKEVSPRARALGTRGEIARDGLIKASEYVSMYALRRKG